MPFVTEHEQLITVLDRAGLWARVDTDSKARLILAGRQ